jgi:hypothetical protein
MDRSTSHKRQLSSGEGAPSKRSNIKDVLNSTPIRPELQACASGPKDRALAPTQYIYVVECDDGDDYGSGFSGVTAVFASLEDAENYVNKEANMPEGQWRVERSSGRLVLKLDLIDDEDDNMLVFMVSRWNVSAKGSTVTTKLVNIAVSCRGTESGSLLMLELSRASGMKMRAKVRMKMRMNTTTIDELWEVIRYMRLVE